jgi:prepilin-type N-terminal cleavage/methylation domain-containing protein
MSRPTPLHRLSDRRQGFTIIELMIATMVFAVVLLLVTSGILQVTRVYYKGVTESTTQNTARGIIDDISQAIQFSGGDVTGTPPPVASSDQMFCINNNQVSYRLGWQVKNDPTASDQTWHGIVMRSGVSGCQSQAAQPLTSEGLLSNSRDLMGQRMRLSNLVVEDLGNNQFRITVRVAYGDSDLLYSPSAPSDSAGATRSDAVCRPVRAGTQFCAVSELSTVVIKRVE